MAEEGVRLETLKGISRGVHKDGGGQMKPEGRRERAPLPLTLDTLLNPP